MNKKHRLTYRVIAKILLLGLFLQSCGTYLNAPLLQLEGNSKQSEHCSTDLIAIQEIDNQELTAEGGYLVNFHAKGGKLEADVSVERNQKVPNYKNLSVVIEPGTNLVRLSRLASNVQQSHIKFQPNKNSQLNRICILKGGILGGMTGGDQPSNQGSTKLTYIKELRKYFYKGYLEIAPSNYQELLGLTKNYEESFTNYEGGVFVKGCDNLSEYSELADLLLSFSKAKKLKVNCVKKNDLELAEVLIRAVQFYEDLAEIDLSGSELADATLQDILESIPYPEKITLLQVGDIELNAEVAALIENRFVQAQIKNSTEFTPPKSSTRNLNNSGKTEANFPLPDLTAYGRLHLNRFLPVIPEKDIIYGKLLGKGGMGIVYQATYQGAMVAAKKLIRFTPEEIASFQKEAIIMANHRHKNLITLVGFCPKEDVLVMEYLPGGSLWSLLKSSEEISWQVRYQIALDVAEGMNYLHGCGILHRDLKSENILLDSERRAKVADFGISLLKSENSTFGTWKEEGSYRWMAPEIFHLEKNTKAGDVYSYGMVLWQLGARKDPFATINNVFQLYTHIKEGNREVISDDTPPELKNIIELCWLPEPPLKQDTDTQQRPTMKEVRYILESVLKKEDEKEKITSTKEIKEKLFLELLNQAQEGDLKAQYEVGIMYAKGEGTLPNEEEAVNWYRKAAEEGYVYAEANLGIMYQLGKGVLKDEQEAVNWYKKAAEKGYALAQCNLGFMYQNGRGGCDQSEREALEWYKKAAAQDHKVAQYNLGCMYQNGTEVPKNDIQARLWYEKSAQQGYASAQSKLAAMIAKGEGGAKDEKQAKSWFEKAAVQGDSFAQEQLRLLKLYELTKHPNYNFGIGKDNQQGHVKRILTGLNATNIRLPDAIATGDIKEVEKSISFLIERGLDINVINTKGYSPVHLAIEKGSLEMVKLLIDNGADANIVDRDGNTPLLMALKNGPKEDIVKFLIEKAVDLNISDKDGFYPLILALERNYLTIVELMVEKGATLDVKNNNGDTALHLSLQKGYEELAQLLIEKGANVNLTNRVQYTPLHNAARGGYLNLVRLLIEKGANTDAQNKYGDTALHLSLRRGYMELAELLIQQGADVNLIDYYGNTPLHEAVEAGHLDIVKLLIEKGARIEAQNKDGDSVLHFSSEKGYEELTRLLIEKGAQVDITNKHRDSPLHRAVDRGSIAIVKLLIEKDAEINAVNNDGYCPLHKAASKGCLAIVELLIQKDAKVNVTAKNGYVSLHGASIGGYLDIVELLIDKGAEINVVDNRGYTPIHEATSNGHLTVVQLLIEKGAEINIVDNIGYTPLDRAVLGEYLGIAQLLIDKGAKINAVDNEGCTPLHKAAKMGHLPIVQLLIDKGAEINTVDNKGCTPLHKAAKMGHLAIVQFLVEKGAEVNTTNKDGYTPLYKVISKIFNKNFREEIAKILINKGSRLTTIGSDSNTLLHYAVNHSYKQVVELLLMNGVELDPQNDDGDTPLGTAILKGELEIVTLFIQKGANLNIRDKNGNTLLHKAVATNKIARVAIAKLLIKHGISIYVRNNKGETPLDSAIEYNNTELIELLTESGAKWIQY